MSDIKLVSNQQPLRSLIYMGRLVNAAASAYVVIPQGMIHSLLQAADRASLNKIRGNKNYAH
jgi:hypothetical protein